jgi:DNA-binding Lrp family transcriptional regulator
MDMCANEKSDYKEAILKLLEDYPFGLTITEISEKIGFHRNTVSKYVNILEAEGDLSKKEISAAKLYFTKKRKHLNRQLITQFIQALLIGLEKEFPNTHEDLKKVGREILENFEFPIGDLYIDEFKKAKASKSLLPKLKLFGEFYNAFDFFQDELNISIIKLNEISITYRIKGSKFLEPPKSCLYFFYIACGIAEATYKNNLDLEIDCAVEDYNVNDNSEQNFVDLSLQLKNST